MNVLNKPNAIEDNDIIEECYRAVVANFIP